VQKSKFLIFSVVSVKLTQLAILLSFLAQFKDAFELKNEILIFNYEMSYIAYH